MATTQTKLVGFGYGNKANYSATTYANHIWFDPTNKQILLNGIEYIPKKLSELVNDKNFITSITKSMVEGVLTGNITSHTHFSISTEGDNRNVATTPNDYSNKFVFKGLKYNSKIGSPASNSYSYLLGLRGWADSSGGQSHELAFNDTGIYRRQGATTEWGSWAKILDSDNYTDYAATKDHTHTFASITSKPNTLGGYGITNAMRFETYDAWSYVNAGFSNSSLAQKAAKAYIEFWQGSSSWFNLKAGKFITNGGTSAQFLKGDGSLDSNTYALASDLSQYLPLTGGTLSGALTCNGDYINMNNDSGSRGYRGFFNQSNSTSRASGSHIFMKGGGEALGTNSVSIGYQAYAGIRNKDSDATTYPYIAWQWMPTEKFMVDTTNSATLSGGEYYGFPLLPNEMVRWDIGGQKVIYENSSSYKELLVVIKASDADTGLVFGGKTTLPYRASKTLIAGKYIVGAGEYLKNITEITINNVKYYQVIIYTWNTSAFPTYYDFTQQVKVMCATKVNNSNYNGASSYASGFYSVASGSSSVASGFYSVASGDSSVASGFYSVASGFYSVASGSSSVASGYSSVASGYSSVASGTSSVASGRYSVASGYSSVASGYSSVASHDHCAVLARNGETMSSYQTIVGKFNAKVAGLFIIGNGTSDTARSNAFVVDDSGNVTAKYFSGYANAIGGEGIKVYATNSNEINFGGTSSSDKIYFGYRSMDSRPTPTKYVFGADGKATLLGSADMLDGYHASNLVKFYLSPMSSGAPADSAKSWFIDTMPAGTGAIVYNVPGSEKTIIAGKSTGRHGHMLQLNYDDNYLRILRYNAGNWKTTDWEKISAGYADTATALTSSAGSATQPIYFSNGKPVACSYTLAKSVPSNAVFTDTTYSVATASADGLMSAAMFKAQMVKSVGVQQGAEMVKPDGTITITDRSVYVTQDKSNITGVYQTASGENDVKIPNATKDYDGSMSYTDKRKLDGISPYAPKKVVMLQVTFNSNGTATINKGGGDFDITQDAEIMNSEYVEETSANGHYAIRLSYDTATSSNPLINWFNNYFVKFSFMSKSTDGTSDFFINLNSNFDGDVLNIQCISTKTKYTDTFDCIWEFY